MEKLPENRPASAQELLATLNAISTAQGEFAPSRPTLRAALAQPKQHLRFLASTLAATLLVALGAFGATTFIEASARNPTPDGFTLWAYRTNTTGTNLHWIAIRGA
jgi:hypothetical protein